MFWLKNKKSISFIMNSYMAVFFCLSQPTSSIEGSYGQQSANIPVDSQEYFRFKLSLA